MPENLVIGLFVFGAVLILISLVGGRFKIFSVAVSSNISSPFIRIIAFILGILAMLLALVPNMISNALANPTENPQPFVTETLQPAPLPTLVYLQPIIVTDTPVPQKPSPTEFVISYWQNINDGRFESAWVQLSPRFRQVAHNNDYGDYLGGYQQMNLCHIDVSNVNLIYQDNYSAIVNAHFEYFMGANCNSSGYNFEMQLVFDETSNSWLLEKNSFR